jgi:DNA-binding NarL/FixJ family response regulator
MIPAHVPKLAESTNGEIEKMKRILLIDDHAIVRRGLRNEIEENLGKMHFGEAESVSEARTALESDIPWDLALLDIGLQKENGLELLGEFVRIEPPRFLVFTHFPAQELGLKAMQLGAYGYVAKTDPPDQIILAIKQVLAGKKYITDSMATQLVLEIGRPQPQDLPHERLSRRELQLMKLIAQGKSQKEAADVMGLNIKTIGTYHTRILLKTRLASDVDVAHYALRHSLIVPAAA